MVHTVNSQVISVERYNRRCKRQQVCHRQMVFAYR